MMVDSSAATHAVVCVEQKSGGTKWKILEAVINFLPSWHFHESFIDVYLQ